MKTPKYLFPGLSILFIAMALLAGCGVPRADYDALQADFDSLQTDYNAVNNELAAIKDVYPPHEFPSRVALEEWLRTNDVSEKPDAESAEGWIARALEIQKDALTDGYIINVDYDGPDEDYVYTIYCTTVIDGNIWVWGPDSDEVIQDTNFMPVN